MPFGAGVGGFVVFDFVGAGVACERLVGAGVAEWLPGSEWLQLRRNHGEHFSRDVELAFRLELHAPVPRTLEKRALGLRECE